MLVPQLPAQPDRLATILMALLLAIGLYSPTSTGEEISVTLQVTTSVILLSILALLLLRRRGILATSALVNAASINVILLVCTLFSPFTEFAYGGYIPIFVLSVLFCVGVSDIALTATTRKLFNIVNALNIALAALLLLQTPVLIQFFTDHYSFGYEGMIPYMLSEGKPVLTFGSHSLAGFFYYLLFYLTFQTFVIAHSKLNLIFAVCYLGLLTLLYSFTALVFTEVAIIQVVLHFQWHKSIRAKVAASVLLFAGIALFVSQYSALDDIRTDLFEVMNRRENGFLGRYSSSGGLMANLDYVADHPFSPIGLGLSQQFWYSDSGPVGYLLRGSFPLLVTVYTGMFLFFRKNLRSKRRALFLLLVFSAFEFGYSNLEYPRTQCLLPFLMVYLNGLDALNPSSAGLAYA